MPRLNLQVCVGWLGQPWESKARITLVRKWRCGEGKEAVASQPGHGGWNLNPGNLSVEPRFLSMCMGACAILLLLFLFVLTHIGICF